jgi:hypothetical protein
MQITVTDPQSGEPEAGVPVAVGYCSLMGIIGADEVSGTTDEGGTVVLPVAVNMVGVTTLMVNDTEFTFFDDFHRQGATLTNQQAIRGREGARRISVKLVPLAGPER